MSAPSSLPAVSRVTACAERDGLCAPNAAYFLQKGALSQLDAAVAETERCLKADDDNQGMVCLATAPEFCVTRRLPGDDRSYCLRRQAVLTLGVLEDFEEALSIEDFGTSCPRKRYLEGTARRVCLSGYGAWFQISGCQVCIDETNFFQGRYAQVCQQKPVEACETPETSAEVDKLLCSSASISASLNSLACPEAPQPLAEAPQPAATAATPAAAAPPAASRSPAVTPEQAVPPVAPALRQPIPPDDVPAAEPILPEEGPLGEATAPAPAGNGVSQLGDLAGLGESLGPPGGQAGGDDDRGLGAGALAGIFVGAILLLLLAAGVALAFQIRRKKRNRRKDKLGVSASMQPQLPLVPQLLAASRGPPASPRVELDAVGSPPGSPAITSTSSALPVSDWKAVPIDGMSTMTRTGAAQHTLASTMPGATTYATTYQYQGSTYDGAVDSMGTFIPMHRAMTADPTEIEHLPADRVVVTQVSGDGDAEGAGFSVRTRTEWTRVGGSITVAPGLPADATQGDMLKAQLDWLLAKRGGLLLGYLKLAPYLGRKIGGQGAVVFAQHSESAAKLYAVKFIFSSKSFDIEKQAAHTKELRDLMPPVEMIVGNTMQRAAVTACMPPPLNRVPLPPVIATEKGESLDDFVGRAAPDFFTSLQVIIHIAQKLEQLHAAGWVHRDLKPGNAIWLPSKNTWTLIDFGCAARIGEEAGMSFSLYYAPPEVIVAYKERRRTILADPSADVWALGVIIWELLTKQKYFKEQTSMRSVVSMLRGDAALPSEQRLPADVRARLSSGAIKDSVFRMLRRRPEERPSISELLAHWTSWFQRGDAS
eukprot:jgi/Ulvmu1/12270/UM087_0004.1